MIIEKDYTNYSVLIVDDEVQICRAISNLLKTIRINSVYALNAEDALQIIKNSPEPFALIISDQRMPGMSGTEFFEQAAIISPNSIRFMITGYADINSMIDAVNRGEVHKYITKPWQNQDFSASVKEGLEQYELEMENVRLFALAKDQNAKLVQLNKILSESAKKQGERLEELDQKISKELYNKSQTEEKSLKDEGITFDLDRIKELTRQSDLLDYDNMNRFYELLLCKIAERFTALNLN